MAKPKNGYVPSNALVIIETGHYEGRAYTSYAETATAAAYNRARTANPDMYLSPPLGAYRSYEDQANLKAHPSEYGSSLPSSKIAGPGNSTHGWGTCVDIGPENAWFQTHSGEYGFTRKSPAGENNHYEFNAPTWAPAIAPVASYQRVAGSGGVNRRPLAKKAATPATVYKAGTVISMLGYVHGETVTLNGITSDLWYYDGGGYFSAVAMTTQTMDGLKDLTPPVAKPPVATAPPVEAPPVAPVDTTSSEQPAPPATTTPSDPTAPSAPVTTVPSAPTGTTKPPTTAKPDVSGKALGWGVAAVAAITAVIAWLTSIGH